MSEDSILSIINSAKFLDGSIFEMRFDTLPKDAEKSEKYQWVLTLGKERFFLDFVSADFKEGKRVLKYFDKEGKPVLINLDLKNRYLELSTGVMYSLIYVFSDRSY